jgi:hypothetical protein
MKVARLLVVLALTAAMGYLLGACGSGNGLPGVSGEVPSGTLPDVTITRPEVTVPTLPTPTVPTRPETTVPTRPETTVQTPLDTTTRPEPPTATQIETTTVVETVTTAPTSPPTTADETSGAQTVAVGQTSSESSTPWGWIILALALLAAGVTLAIVTWRRQRGTR